MRGVREILKEPGLARQTEKNVWRFLRREKLRLNAAQLDQLLDAAPPKLIRFYWPVAGAVRTLRQTGCGGLWRKIQRWFGRGVET